LLKNTPKIDYWALNRDGLEEKARESGVEIAKGAGKAEIADEIYKNIAGRGLFNRPS